MKYITSNFIGNNEVILNIGSFKNVNLVSAVREEVCEKIWKKNLKLLAVFNNKIYYYNECNELCFMYLMKYIEEISKLGRIKNHLLISQLTKNGIKLVTGNEVI